MAAELLGVFLIFIARLFGITCSVLRILFLVKGRHFIASCAGFVEVMAYILVLDRILGGGKTMSFMQLMAYCGGFSAGNYLGAWLEEILLNSFFMVEAIMSDNPSSKSTVDALRAAGLGVTVMNGMGRDGPKLVVKVFCRQRDIAAVQKFFTNQSFVTVSGVKHCAGGWFPKRL